MASLRGEAVDREVGIILAQFFRAILPRDITSLLICILICRVIFQLHDGPNISDPFTPRAPGGRDGLVPLFCSLRAKDPQP